MPPPNTPATPYQHLALVLPQTSEQPENAQESALLHTPPNPPATTGLLTPPSSNQPSTPVRGRGRERDRTYNDSPVPISWQAPNDVPRIETSCGDCSSQDLCPLHDFISEEDQTSDLEAGPPPKRLVRRPTPVSRTSKPKLRLQTSPKIANLKAKANEGKNAAEAGAAAQGSILVRQTTNDSTPESSSTLLGSGSTPGSASKKWRKVTFAPAAETRTDTALSTPTRPLLPRNPSSGSSTESMSGFETAKRKMQRLFFPRRCMSESRGPCHHTDRNHIEPCTPVSLPRRVSRLPSFFTRERLLLPQHVQRRDFVLMIGVGFLSALFLSVGVLAATDPASVCKVTWLATAIDSFLPNLAISTPYTLLVVGFAVSGAGRGWISGRYTPLLYATCAALGRVFVGSLTGNINWKVMHCPGGSQ